MSGKTLLAIGLIVAGILALAYGGFTYTKDDHTATVGPLELSVKERETVNIPKWAGICAIAAGLILLAPRKRGST